MDAIATDVAAVLSSGARISLALTGGGMGAIPRLLAVPGASRAILEVLVPYSERNLAEYLGIVPEQYCSEETALAMAAVARRRAGRADDAGRANDAGPGTFPVGVGVTAALVSDRPKRGPHRAFVAVDSPHATSCHTLELDKGSRGRSAEDALVSEWVVSALADHVAISGEFAGGHARLQVETRELATTGRDRARMAVARAPEPLASLAFGDHSLAWRMPSGDWSRYAPAVPPRGILSGSFNPPHEGHRLLRQVAERRLGGPVAWELSVENVQKPPLDFLRLARRLEQLSDGMVAVSRPALFAEKGGLFPGATFVIGYDTALRLLDPRFHGGSWEGVAEALGAVRRNGNRFLVAGRNSGNGFQNQANFAGPVEFSDLFDFLGEEEFRVDISSTDLRRQARLGEPATDHVDPADE